MRAIIFAVLAVLCAVVYAQECTLSDGCHGTCIPVAQCTGTMRSEAGKCRGQPANIKCCTSQPRGSCGGGKPAHRGARSSGGAAAAGPDAAAATAPATQSTAADPAAAAAVDPAAAVVAAAAPAAPGAAAGAAAGPAAAAGKKILVVGDSQSVGTFGATILQELKTAGATVEIHAACGKSPTHFLTGGSDNCGIRDNERTSTGKTQKLADMMKAVTPKPDLVIVELGGNGVTGAKQFVTQLNGAPCMWVGPALATAKAKSEKNKHIDQYYATLAKDAPPCVVVDTRTIVGPPEGSPDGLHYTGGAAPLGVKWAKAIATKAYEMLGGAAAAPAVPGAAAAAAPDAAAAAPVATSSADAAALLFAPAAPAPGALAPTPAARFVSKRVYRLNAFDAEA